MPSIPTDNSSRAFSLAAFHAACFNMVSLASASRVVCVARSCFLASCLAARSSLAFTLTEYFLAVALFLAIIRSYSCKVVMRYTSIDTLCM